MKNILFVSLFLIFSSKAYALEISCFTDYHVLAFYEDGTAHAIETEQENFTLNFEKGELNFYESILMGRPIGAIAGSIFDSQTTGGPSAVIDGVQLVIVDPETNQRLVSIVPLAAKRSHLAIELKNYPPILENERTRYYFWAIGCRW